jgi:hypothetical protein
MPLRSLAVGAQPCTAMAWFLHPECGRKVPGCNQHLVFRTGILRRDPATGADDSGREKIAGAGRQACTPQHAAQAVVKFAVFLRLRDAVRGPALAVDPCWFGKMQDAPYLEAQYSLTTLSCGFL